MLMLEVETDSDDDTEKKKCASGPSSDLASLKTLNEGNVVLDKTTNRKGRKRNINLPQNGNIEDSLSKAKKRRTSKISCGRKPIPNDNKDDSGIIEENETESKSSWKCDNCLKTFVSEKTLTRHKLLFPDNHVFPCEQCNAVFNREKALAKHRFFKHPVALTSNISTESISCSFCSLTFPTSEDLEKHKDSMHGTTVEVENAPQYTCNVCGKNFISEEGFKYHEKYSHIEGDKAKGRRSTGGRDEETLICKICSASFETKPALQTHLKSHHVTKNMKFKTGSYQCCICPRSFKSNDGLKYHLATHTGEKRYKCGVCDRRFIKKTHLVEHIATHSEEKYFKCERCPRTFTTYSAFKKHVRTFPGPHNFTCEKCGKVFSKESMLEKHVCMKLEAVTLDPEVTSQLTEDMIEQYLCLTEEADKEAGLKSCYKCFRVFPNLEALQEHQKEHLGKQIYQCRFCPQTMLRADAFSAHIRNHLGSTPYMCLHCNRKFISPMTLAAHAKKFPGEHSFTCELCKRWFPSPESLDKHECILQNCDVFLCACGLQIRDWNEFLAHFDTKPYKCCVCEQKYLTLLPLTRHIKFHTGIKPYSCPVCGKSFRAKANCRNHQKTHDNSSVVSCDVCNYRTTSQKRLDIHKSKKHDILNVSNSTLCPVCGILFKTLSIMRKHIEMEHENSFSIAGFPESVNNKSLNQELCNLCGKLLQNKYSLVSHMKKVHEVGDNAPTPSLTCEICGETFRTSRLMTRHKEVHDKDSPQSCTLCELQFDNAKDLKKHMRKHDTIKPYSCQRCGKHFKVAVSLKYHNNICRSDRIEENEEEPVYPAIETIFLVSEKWQLSDVALT